MKINHLSIENFRNFSRAEFGFSDKMFISGKNGTGKSSMLESIYYFSGMKSFRQNGDSRLVQIGKESFLLGCRGEKESEPFKMGISYESGKKLVSINEERVRRNTESFGVFLAAVISGYDKQLSGSSAGIRRKFCDRIISIIDNEYLTKLIEYYSILRMRNAVLRTGGDSKQVSIYSTQMSQRSVYIYERRLEFIEYLKGAVTEVYERMFDKEVAIDIRYFSSKDGGGYTDLPLFEAHEKKKAEEYKRGRTMIGVHLDDFIISINNMKITEIGSEGERMLLGLALKSAEIELVYENIGEYPIVLLDDPFAEMDTQRTSKMLDFFQQYPQVIFASPKTEDNIYSFEVIDLDIVKKTWE